MWIEIEVGMHAGTLWIVMVWKVVLDAGMCLLTLHLLPAHICVRTRGPHWNWCMLVGIMWKAVVWKVVRNAGVCLLTLRFLPVHTFVCGHVDHIGFGACM